MLSPYRMIVNAGFALWLTAHGLAVKTVQETVARVKHYFRMGYKPTPTSVMAYIAWKRDNCTNNSINVYLKALKNYGMFKGLEVFKSLKMLPKNESVRATFSTVELSRFLAVTMPHSNRTKCEYGLFWKFLAYTGMRPGELANVRTGDVSFAEDVLYLPKTKTGSRKVPIPPNLKDEFITHCNQCEDKLFPTNEQLWFQNFHRRLEMAGIKRRLQPYSLRHTFITTMLQQPGVNLLDVQSVVGHRKANTTQRYYHLCLDRLRRVIAMHPMGKTDAYSRAKLIREMINTMGSDFDTKLEPVSNGYKLVIIVRGS